MQNWAWQELEAQVEDHGAATVRFYAPGTDPDEDIELVIADIKFEDGEVKVVLE